MYRSITIHVGKRPRRQFAELFDTFCLNPRSPNHLKNFRRQLDLLVDRGWLVADSSTADTFWSIGAQAPEELGGPKRELVPPPQYDRLRCAPYIAPSNQVTRSGSQDFKLVASLGVPC